MNAKKINLISAKPAAQTLFAKHCYTGRREVEAAVRSGSTREDALAALFAKLEPFFEPASVALVVKTVRTILEAEYA